ncbi:diguanylate cyclase [Roseiarcaceae bacterium H3SJ34-1]|uniref:diguanylate cyclase n=1 Tax=Terripilifer ovatus TaxID=3032367 RepID=UPI003AB99BB8|nr:diguanylate cyclase [Roseiarcaceae bacterium H3SJ34-1]
MRLATITNWAYGATIVLTFASGATMLLASNVQERERAAVAQRERLDQASSKVAVEINALSNKAREYVITGDPGHIEVYRREISALRTVEERVRSIEDVGASADELNALADAMRLADLLHDEQEEAIKARQEGDVERARNIVFGIEYDRQLHRVAADVERFQYRLDQRTDSEVAAAADVSRLWKTFSEIVLAITGLLFLCVLYFVFKRRVLRPVVKLSDVVNRLAAQDYAVEPPAYDDIDEIGDMAQAIRVFRENGLERQRLEEERSADHAKRSLLSRMTQRMQECESMHQLERVIESFVPQIAPGLAGRLYLFDEAQNLLVEVCSWLAPEHSQAAFPPAACWALQRGELHRPRGHDADVVCDHLHITGSNSDSICLPLIAQRATLGLLYLEPLTSASETLPDVPEMYLKILAENVGLAVGNLRLRDTLRAMAMADPLTGLANRRQLDTVLQSRLIEANEAKQSVSCIMLDIDHFKHFNDQYGHDAGDAVLRGVAEILKQSTRDTDAFRYGGEEFLLLMPNMSAEKAAQRAEALRVKIGAIQIEHAGHDLGAITASFGTATAPDHCALSKLVRTADAALLRAKEAGRNRVIQAEPRQPQASGRTMTPEQAPASER